jgi:hypothetical protein
VGIEDALMIARYLRDRTLGELDYLSPSGYEERYRQTQTESAEAA